MPVYILGNNNYLLITSRAALPVFIERKFQCMVDRKNATSFYFVHLAKLNMKSNNIGQLSLTVTAVCLVGFTTSLSANAATLYNVLDVGIAGRTASATGINDLGQVIGIIQLPSGIESFRTSPNSPFNPATDIIPSRSSTGVPTGINNSGQVVGSVFSAGYITPPNGSTLVVRGLFDSPRAINDLGQVTGQDSVIDPNTSSSVFRAVVIATSGSGGPLVDLGTLGGRTSFGNGINNLGQVVGASATANGETHAFRTAANSAINAATDDLGTLGGSSSNARDINDLGQVVGSSTTASGQLHAFLTAANSAINPDTDDLGTLGGNFSIAYSLNESGLVVGDSELADGSDRAFLYDGTELFDLNTLITGDIDLVLTSARGINENGQIAATGFFADTRTSRAFLLTPVPEPASMLGVLAFGAGAGFLRTRAAKQKVKA